MTRLLYTATIPESALQDNSGRTAAQRELSKLAALDANGSVTNTGSRPNEVSLSGKYTAKYADLATLELLELLNAAGFDALAFSDPENEAPERGYYVAEDPTAGRVQPQSGLASTFSATLVREGTATSHRRLVSPDTTQRAHQFGTATDATVGLPAATTDVEWVDADRTESAPATPTATVTAEEGAVDLYRVDQAPVTGDNAQLAYTWPAGADGRPRIQDEGNVDAAVYDTWGNPEVDPGGVFAWQQVFSADHEYRGDIVIENGLIQLRIRLDTSPLTLTATEYTGTNWARTALGTSDWRLSGADLVAIRPTAVRARFRFTDTGGSDTHTLDAVVHRGWDAVQFLEPADSEQNLLQSSQAPQGLVDRLDPIAAASRIDPEARQGLIKTGDIPL